MMTTTLQTTANDYQEQELTDTAFVIGGKVYKIIHVVRRTNPQTVRMHNAKGFEPDTYYGFGSRSDLGCYIQRKLDGEYVIVDRIRLK